MKIVSTRTHFTAYACFSEVTVDGEFECYLLEDTDRKLESGGTKIYAQTAIPRGTYEIVITRSPRFKKDLVLFVNVPGFMGVRMHPGNKPDDSEGCVLPGTRIDVEKNWISNSKVAHDALFKKIKSALDAGEHVTWEIR